MIFLAISHVRYGVLNRSKQVFNQSRMIFNKH